MRSNAISKMMGGLLAVLLLAALSAAPAFASGKPFVETKAATNVAEKEATLNGVVNPNGAATKYYFEYYAGKGAWVKTAEISAGSGTTNLEEGAALSGLKAEEPYHFRIVAMNSNGTTTGATLAFETTTAPGLPEFKFGELKSVKFTLKGTGVTFTNVAGTTYSCTASKGEGELTGPKTASVRLVFTLCGAANFGCKSPGAEAEEIKTGALPAVLRYISKEKHEAGLVINYHEEKFAEWECSGFGGGLGIHGSIIAPITEVNVSSTTHTLNLVAGGSKNAQQEPKSFEGAEGNVSASPTLALISPSYEEGSVGSSFTMTSSHAVEVKA
jgi:hypothetical protein